MLLTCRRMLAWVCLSLGLALASVPAAAHPADALAAAQASSATVAAVRWVLASDDHRGRPFAIVDKKDARLFVFDPAGRLVGATPVLLGLTPGDGALVATMGDRPVASLTPAERTTPAGRFDSEPGLNDRGEAIVWIDYDAALAIHRLRPAPAHERRAERLASPDPAQRRISFGCVVVPVAFYEDVIATTLGRARGVVYVLPEERETAAPYRAAAAAATEKL